MAMEVVKVYKEHYPALRFIGTKYTNDDRGADGGFGAQWGEWLSEGRFEKLTAQVPVAPFDSAAIGLMTMTGKMTDFTYWVGLFYPAGAAVPEGFDSLDLPESNIGMGWVKGSSDSGEVFGGPPHEAVCKRLDEEKIGKFRNDVTGAGSDTYCFFERYDAARFHEKDANGDIILDYGNYFKL